MLATNLFLQTWPASVSCLPTEQKLSSLQSVLHLFLPIMHFSAVPTSSIAPYFCNSCVKRSPAACTPARVRQFPHPQRHSQTGGKQHNHQISESSKCMTGSEFRNRGWFHQQLSKGVMNVSSSVSELAEVRQAADPFICTSSVCCLKHRRQSGWPDVWHRLISRSMSVSLMFILPDVSASVFLLFFTVCHHWTWNVQRNIHLFWMFNQAPIFHHSLLCDFFWNLEICSHFESVNFLLLLVSSLSPAGWVTSSPDTAAASTCWKRASTGISMSLVPAAPRCSPSGASATCSGTPTAATPCPPSESQRGRGREGLKQRPRPRAGKEMEREAEEGGQRGRGGGKGCSNWCRSFLVAS